MRVVLKIDYDGNPYLLLKSEKPQLRLSESSIEDELLELFVRKAKSKGIVLKNESDMETRDDYMSIRLKGKENENDCNRKHKVF